ncbi:MIP family channel protein [Nocardioides sp. W3-2-3]|uniref:MIP/aquaporin family protein n=1 Tax=Nocardioides convexus TaxID=2712224 RepID=UPI00241827BE|nr:aquaporin [Nocardioides convexus]NHA01684.1 MIP family channel protein [Nocardioides convexus]
MLAEFLGTFVLVFIGCGAAFTTGADVAATGLAFGIAIVIMAYSFGRISGGHFNPAVSVGAALAGRISWKDTGLYAAAQTAGALVGGFVLAITILASDVGWGFGDPLGNNGFGEAGTVEWGGALLIEIFLTFIFLIVILGVTDDRNRAIAAQAPLAIGPALAAIHFVGINATGTSVNPARSIGVAFFSGGDAIQDLWLFIVAPLIGAALAGVLYPVLFGRDKDPVVGSGLRLRQRRLLRPGLHPAVEPAAGWLRPAAAAAGPADHPGRLAVGPRRAAVDPGPAAAGLPLRPGPGRRSGAGPEPGWRLGAPAGRPDPGPPPAVTLVERVSGV